MSSFVCVCVCVCVCAVRECVRVCVSLALSVLCVCVSSSLCMFVCVRVSVLELYCVCCSHAFQKKKAQHAKVRLMMWSSKTYIACINNSVHSFMLYDNYFKFMIVSHQ